jgi:hypothetical protein
MPITVIRDVTSLFFKFIKEECAACSHLCVWIIPLFRLSRASIRLFVYERNFMWPRCSTHMKKTQVRRHTKHAFVPMSSSFAYCKRLFLYMYAGTRTYGTKKESKNGFHRQKIIYVCMHAICIYMQACTQLHVCLHASTHSHTSCSGCSYARNGAPRSGHNRHRRSVHATECEQISLCRGTCVVIKSERAGSFASQIFVYMRFNCTQKSHFRTSLRITFMILRGAGFPAANTM